jgi:hypothetical protein
MRAPGCTVLSIDEIWQAYRFVCTMIVLIGTLAWRKRGRRKMPRLERV